MQLQFRPLEKCWDGWTNVWFYWRLENHLVSKIWSSPELLPRRPCRSSAEGSHGAACVLLPLCVWVPPQPPVCIWLLSPCSCKLLFAIFRESSGFLKKYSCRFVGLTILTSLPKRCLFLFWCWKCHRRVVGPAPLVLLSVAPGCLPGSRWRPPPHPFLSPTT